MAVKVDDWFAVSRAGLRQLMEGKPKSFILRELVQNAWDEPGVTFVRISLEHVDHGVAELIVIDDAPEGFHDIAHAYTLFAKTRKRKDPTARGRFNLGEKQVLALCIEASIKTTTGTISFNEDGTRKKTKGQTIAGSVFSAKIRMNKVEIRECVESIKSFLVPHNIETTINSERIEPREPVASTAAKLTTEYEHEDGSWRRTKRKTEVRVFSPRDGEQAMLYEMGIPVVELEAGDCFHYDVNQRVPLNQDRDNVSPAYLRDLRGEVINVVADKLTEEQAAESWAREATDGDRIRKEAFDTIIQKRYGNKVASFSPNDLEANNAAVSRGYTVLSGGAMTKGEWSNAKRFESISSAAVIAPTNHARFGPSGEDTSIPEDKWTTGMHDVVEYAERLGRELIGGVMVRIVKSKQGFDACYGSREVTFNYNRLGKDFFDMHANRARITSLIIHELAHEAESNHLDMRYIREVARLAGLVVELALTNKRLFTPKRRKVTKS